MERQRRARIPEDTILIPVGRGWNRVDRDGPMRISYPCLKSYEQRGRTLLSFRSRPVKLASGREPKRKEGDVTSRLKRIKRSELYKSAWPRPPTGILFFAYEFHSVSPQQNTQPSLRLHLLLARGYHCSDSLKIYICY